MNTEQIMALADAYAIDYSLGYRGENGKARAALEAALASQGDALTEKQSRVEAWGDQLVTIVTAPVAKQEPHTDHPMRHYDRTCPACNVQEPVAEVVTDNSRELVVRSMSNVYLRKGQKLYTHPAPVNQQLLEFAQWVLSLKTGGMIEGKARAAIAAAEGKV